MHARRRAKLRMRGLVLLELLVAAAVLALLVAMAAPSFAAVSERLKLRAATQALTSGLYAARAEAYKRGGQVIFAAEKSDAGCSPGKKGSPWSCGWIAFADTNDDGERNGVEEVIFVGQPPAGIDVAESRETRKFKLNAWGKFNGLSAFGFVLTSRDGAATPSVVCVASGGRIRTEHGKDAC